MASANAPVPFEMNPERPAQLDLLLPNGVSLIWQLVTKYHLRVIDHRCTYRSEGTG